MFPCSRISCTISLSSCHSSQRLSACALVRLCACPVCYFWRSRLASSRNESNSQQPTAQPTHRHRPPDKRELQEAFGALPNSPRFSLKLSPSQATQHRHFFSLSLSPLDLATSAFSVAFLNSPYHLVDIVASPYLPTIIHPASSSPFLCSLSYCSLSVCSLSYCFLQSRDAAFLAFLFFPFLSFPFLPPPTPFSLILLHPC